MSKQQYFSFSCTFCQKFSCNFVDQKLNKAKPINKPGTRVCLEWDLIVRDLCGQVSDPLGQSGHPPIQAFNLVEALKNNNFYRDLKAKKLRNSRDRFEITQRFPMQSWLRFLGIHNIPSLGTSNENKIRYFRNKILLYTFFIKNIFSEQRYPPPPPLAESVDFIGGKSLSTVHV